MKFKPITRNLVSMYAAMHVLASGCATSHTSSKKSVEVSSRRIEFVNYNPWELTFNELSEAVEHDSKTVGYMERFDGIKAKIKSDESYDAQQDVRSLHSDIMRSSLDDKEGLAKIMEDFSYYKEEYTLNEKWKDKQLTKVVGYSIAGVCSLGSGLALAKVAKDNGGDEAGSFTVGALAGLMFGFLFVTEVPFPWLKDSKTDYKRTFIRPFYGTGEKAK